MQPMQKQSYQKRFPLKKAGWKEALSSDIIQNTHWYKGYALETQHSKSTPEAEREVDVTRDYLARLCLRTTHPQTQYGKKIIIHKYSLGK